jgi:hypothetical protein
LEFLNVEAIIGVVPIVPETQKKRKENPCTNNDSK